MSNGSLFDKSIILAMMSASRTLANYLVWQMIGSFVPYLPMSFLEANLELQRTLYGINSLQPLWERCVDRSTGAVPLAIGALYVGNRFGQSQKQDVSVVII